MDRFCQHCRTHLSSRHQLEDHMRQKHSHQFGGRNDRGTDFVQYCAKLGYSRDMANRALRQLGPSASTNDLLEVVLKTMNAQKHEYFKRGSGTGFGGLELNKRF
ncbi:hypothetical protein ACHWQZ_G014002 [Mnemiopsis leidyi]